MIMQDLRIKPKCPQCGSENVKSKLSFTNVVAWAGRILGVPTVKIFEKKCVEYGYETATAVHFQFKQVTRSSAAALHFIEGFADVLRSLA